MRATGRYPSRPGTSAAWLGCRYHQWIPDTFAASLRLQPRNAKFASSRTLSPCSSSLLEYHVRKNLPASVRYVPPSAAKNRVSSGVSLYSPAASPGSSHSGCPASVAAALKSSSRGKLILPGTVRCRGIPNLGSPVYLDGSSAMEQRPVVHADGEVLVVPRAAGARVVHVGVGVADVADPARQRDGDGVADVAAAGVERHDGLHLEAFLLRHAEQLPVRAPLVPRRPGGLDDAPPHVRHDAVDAGLPPQPPQPRPQPRRVLQLVLRGDHAQLHATPRRGAA
uniref:Uncharacterized protein n=2 Tax=Oryza meridionalis TaxID=40149 RepID=A0A0E0ECQ6_9ORYZ